MDRRPDAEGDRLLVEGRAGREEPPRRGRRLPPAAVAAGIVIAAVTTLGTDLAPPVPAEETAPVAPPLPPEPATPLVGDLPAAGPVLGEETGVVLLLDDGHTGVLAVDPDRRLWARTPIEGQRAGDHSPRLHRTGPALVVGWGAVHAVDIRSGRALPLGEAQLFRPAAEEGVVWLVDDPAPGELRAWEAAVDGTWRGEPAPIGVDGFPLLGVPGGLAIQVDRGIALWRKEDGRVEHLPAPSPGHAHDVSGSRLVWCSGDCGTLTITDTDTLSSEVHSAPPGYDRFIGSGLARWSPDGRHLAALLGQAHSLEAEALWVLDRDQGTVRVVAPQGSRASYLAWSPDGSQVFASSYSFGRRRTSLWRYDVGDGSGGAVDLPVGGALWPVAIEDRFAHAWLPECIEDSGPSCAVGFRP